MKNCLMTRGFPGSGKSRFIQNLLLNLTERGFYDIDLGLRIKAKSAVVVSADDYFMDSEGVYRFDPALIGDAHIDCMKRFLLAVGSDEPLVIVDNTNINAFEMAPYVAVAAAFDYDVTIIQMNAKVEDCITRNLHGVSAQTIGGMAEALRRESLPPWWRVIKKNSE